MVYICCLLHVKLKVDAQISCIHNVALGFGCVHTTKKIPHGCFLLLALG